MKKMMMLIAAVLLSWGDITLAFAETTTPQYEDYATALMCKKPGTLKLNFAGNNPPATMRTALQAASKQQPNFAGHYILTTWRCGTYCQRLAIIDSDNGNVYQPQIGKSEWADYLLGWSYETPRADSKLLVVNVQLSSVPLNNSKAMQSKSRNLKVYYSWDENQLVQLQ